MHPTRAGIYFIILVLAFFGLLFSQTKKAVTPPQPEQQITQKPSDGEGKVLGGGCSTNEIITIKNNSISPTQITATYLSHSSKYFVCVYIYDTGEHTLVADDGSWSHTRDGPPPGGTDPYFSTKYFSSPGVYPYHLQSNPNAKGTIYAGTSPDNQPPSAPSGLKTTSVKRTSVTLAWNASTDNKGVSGYRVYRNGVWTYTTTSTSITDSSLKPGKKYNYYVKAYDAAGNVSSASNTISVNTTETISDVKLPSLFRTKGSKTTNLAKIKDPKKVKSFTLDVVGKSKIVFNDALNLSSLKVPSLFKSLDKYIKMAKLGVVDVDTKTLTMLAKKKATVSMFKLPFVATPDILVNGKTDAGKVLSNIKYEEGTLTFSVKNFSKFEAVPKLEILEPKNDFKESKPNITLKGKISDPEASVSVKLNGQTLGKLNVASSSGEFSRELALTEGENNIVVEALSKFGPSLSTTVSGVFTKPMLGTAQIIGIGLLLILLTMATGGWRYYKKLKAHQISSPDKEKPTSG